VFDALAADLGARGGAEGVEVALDRSDGVAVIIDEQAMSGAAREGFEPKRAGAAKRSATCSPSKLPRRLCSIENSPSRARSLVGRVARPSGAISGRPRQVPAIILT
jgi:hypothetical protein